MTRIVFLCCGLTWLAACSSVSGPVQFYAGVHRPDSETAHLHVPAALTVEKIDGKEVDVPSILAGSYNIFLLPGQHRIDFKYEFSWGSEADDMLVKSDVVSIRTMFNAGKDYELRYAVPSGKEQAWQMTRHFKATLMEKDTGRQVASILAEKMNELPNAQAEAYNSGAIPPKPKKVVTTSDNKTGIAVPSGITADKAAHEDAVKRLKFWWLTATPQERKQFKAWMQSIEGLK